MKKIGCKVACRTLMTLGSKTKGVSLSPGDPSMHVVRYFVGGALAFAAIGACGGSIEGDRCGPGTHDEGGACLPDSTSSTSPEEPGSSRNPTAEAGLLDVREASSDATVDAGDAGSVDVTTACRGTTNTFIVEGDDWVHTGPPLVLAGGAGWRASVRNAVNDEPSYVSIWAGDNWVAEFSTRSLGKPLLPGTYTGAQRAAFTDPNHPGLDVFGNGAGCNEVSGQFTVVEMTSTPPGDAGFPFPPPSIPTVTSFTAYFEQHCEGGPRANYGCVHFQL